MFFHTLQIHQNVINEYHDKLVQFWHENQVHKVHEGCVWSVSELAWSGYVLFFLCLVRNEWSEAERTSYGKQILVVDNGRGHSPKMTEPARS
jgi:hypothetical protein